MQENIQNQGICIFFNMDYHYNGSSQHIKLVSEQKYFDKNIKKYNMIRKEISEKIFS